MQPSFIFSHVPRLFWVILAIGIQLILWVASPNIVNAQTVTATPTITLLPTPTETPTPKVVPTATLSVEERLALLEEKIKKPTKDGWDMLYSASGLLGLLGSLITSGLLVWVIHRSTQAFNQRQLESEVKRAERESKIAEIQTVQSFIPQLQSDDSRAVETSLFALEELGNEALAARLTKLYQTDGAKKALNKVSASGNAKVSDAALGAIFKTPMRSIVQIACGGNTRGAGFFAHTEGYIVTTQNAISGEGSITITTSQATLPAKLIFQDEQANLALLKVDGTVFSVMPISNTVDVDPLSEVFLIGYDPQVGLVVSPGKVVGKNPFLNYPISELINISVNVPRSYGGASVISREGLFIGMVVLLKLNDSGHATTAYILPSAILAEFVENKIPK
jgi:S1-C subfamily serine protease